MSDDTVDLPSTDQYSHGLEDLRLFEYMGKLCFISTNVNYSENGFNRMLIGEYNADKLSYTNCRILQPPMNTRCEKNWIPIVSNGELYFIYSWFPMQIGRLDNYKLTIFKTYNVNIPNFHRVRGSTIFINDAETLLGVVHFSDECFPRQYYHMLIRLDPVSFFPISYSDPFCFQHYGVEFCIGFTIRDNEYIFWVSKKDNDATMIVVDREHISFQNNLP
jgi:hypothetical protein